MENDPKKNVISTGTASIVLIFVMLCLLTFSVLSLVSAQANLRLSRKSADRTTDYYAAENEANDILLRLEAIMDECLADGGEDGFFDRVLTRARSDISGVSFTADGENALSYSVLLGEDQALCVSLSLSAQTLPNGRHYQITAWNTSSSYDWGADQTIDLFDPSAILSGDTEE